MINNYREAFKRGNKPYELFHSGAIDLEALAQELKTLNYSWEQRYNYLKGLALDDYENNGSCAETLVRFASTGVWRRQSPSEIADIVIRNHAGAVAATLECKTGAFGISDEFYTLDKFLRFKHATHVVLIPRFCGMDDIRAARVFPVRKFYEFITSDKRFIREGKDNGRGGKKLAMQSWLPTKSTEGGKIRAIILDWIYENGEPLDKFLKRIDANSLLS